MSNLPAPSVFEKQALNRVEQEMLKNILAGNPYMRGPDGAMIEIPKHEQKRLLAAAQGRNWGLDVANRQTLDTEPFTRADAVSRGDRAKMDKSQVGSRRLQNKATRIGITPQQMEAATRAGLDPTSAKATYQNSLQNTASPGQLKKIQAGTGMRGTPPPPLPKTRPTSRKSFASPAAKHQQLSASNAKNIAAGKAKPGAPRAAFNPDNTGPIGRWFSNLFAGSAPKPAISPGGGFNAFSRAGTAAAGKAAPAAPAAASGAARRLTGILSKIPGGGKLKALALPAGYAATALGGHFAGKAMGGSYD